MVSFVERSPIAVLALICAASMALVIAAGWQGPPLADEGFFTDPARHLARDGFLGTTVLESAGSGNLRIQERTYWVMPFYLVLQAAYLKVAPDSLRSVRFLSVLMIPLALVSFWIVLDRLGWPRMASLGAAALLGISYPLLTAARLARPDLLAFALGWAGVALYVALRERRFLLAVLLSQTALMLSALTHPNAVLPFLALVVIAVWQDRSRWGMFPVAVGLIPYLAGFGAWGLYILQDTEAFWAQFRYNSADRVALSLNPVSVIWSEIRLRYFTTYLIQPGSLRSLLRLVMPFSLFAALAAVWVLPGLRRNPGVRAMGVIALGTFLVQCVFNQKLTQYTVFGAAPFTALLTAWVAAWWEERPGWRPLLTGWMGLLLLFPISSVVTWARAESGVSSLREIREFLKVNAPAAGIIHGSSAFVHELGFDPRLKDDRFLGAYTGLRADVILVADYLTRANYEWLSQYAPEQMELIRQRMAEYRVVMVRPHYQVLFRNTMPDPVRPDPASAGVLGRPGKIEW